MARSKNKKKKARKPRKRTPSSRKPSMNIEDKMALVNAYIEYSSCNSTEAIQFIDLGERNPVYKLVHNFSKALASVDIRYSSTLNSLEQVAQEYCSWADELDQNKVAQKFKNPLPEAADTLKQILDVVESSPYASELEGFAHLKEIKKFVDKNSIQDTEKEWVVIKNAINAFTETMGELYTASGVHGTKWYAKLFIENMVLATFPSMEGNVARIADSALNSPSVITSSLKNLVKEKENCKKIDAQYLSEIIDALIVPGKEVEILEYVASKKEGLEKHSDKKVLAKLVKAADSQARLDLVSKLAESSSHGKTYHGLSKVLASEALTNYIMHLQDTDIHIQEKTHTFGTIIEDVVAKGKLRSAALLIQNYKAFASDPKNKQVWDMARDATNSELLVKDYFEVVQEGKENVANAYLYVAKHSLDALVLKGIRTALNAARDSELTWIKEDMPLKTFRNTLQSGLNGNVLGYAGNSNNGSNSRKSKSRSRGGRRNTTLSEMEEILGKRSMKQVRHAQHLLGSASRRIAYVWENKPDEIVSFAKQITQYHESKALQLVLKDNTLFGLYVNNLGDEKTTTELNNIFENAGANPYAQLHAVLNPEKERELPKNGGETQKTRNMQTNGIGNILVWCGQCSPEVKQKLQNFAKTYPIEFYDANNWRTDVSHIGKNDVVVHYGNTFERNMYPVLKNACKTTGAKLHQHNGGASSLITFLERLV